MAIHPGTTPEQSASGRPQEAPSLGNFCDACQAIPAHGYCNIAGCPNAIVVGHKSMTDGSHEGVHAGTDGEGSRDEQP